MSKGNKSIVLIGLFIVFLIIAAIGGGGFFGYKMYLEHKDKFFKELESLPKFDQVEAEKQSAEKLGVAYPVPKPLKSVSKIQAEVEEIVKSEISRKFPASELTGKVKEVMKEYASAKVGDKVKFQTKKDNSLITGVYKGVRTEGKHSKLVLIEDVSSRIDRYRVKDIIEENLYIFDEGVSLRRQQVEVSEIKKELNKKKRAFGEKVRLKNAAMIYKASNYIKNSDNNWVSLISVIDKMTASEKVKFYKDRKRKIEELKEEFKFLGMIEIEIPSRIMDKLNKSN